MSASGSPSPGSPFPWKPRVKVWFEVEGGGYSFGFGLIAILQAVDKAGAIKQAAEDLGQSYRHVWGRIKEAEQGLATPLVITHVGGQGSQAQRAHRRRPTPHQRLFHPPQPHGRRHGSPPQPVTHPLTPCTPHTRPLNSFST